MAYYLVDYENVKADGMYGVDQLGKKDCVCIFYSENASTLTFGLHEKLNQTKGKIVLQKVEVGVKNALDFQLSTYLGYLISENEGKNETYYIVSEDKGLAILTGYWAERGENVKTASDIAAAKEDLEEEKPSKTEKKEKKEKPGNPEKMEKAEKESGEEREKPDQQKKFHGKKQQKKENAHPGQTTRLQVHTRKQETKSQNPAQQKPDKGTSRQTWHQSGGYGKTGRSVPADDQSDRAGGLFTVGNAGAEAGKDLSGNRGRYFQLYGGRE